MKRNIIISILGKIWSDLVLLLFFMVLVILLDSILLKILFVILVLFTLTIPFLVYVYSFLWEIERKCPNCGSKINIKTKKCGNCGVWLVKKESEIGEYDENTIDKDENKYFTVGLMNFYKQDTGVLLFRDDKLNMLFVKEKAIERSIKDIYSVKNIVSRYIAILFVTGEEWVVWANPGETKKIIDWINYHRDKVR